MKQINTQLSCFQSSDGAGALFSNCRKYRYALWRIWDANKPHVMFIGLNPSTANETQADPTIESVIRISKFNGYGGFYMMNCFPFVSTDPKALIAIADSVEQQENNRLLQEIKFKCADVVFAWGNFKVVKDLGRDIELQQMFPGAKCLSKNRNGSPGHPLYKKEKTTLIDFIKKS